MEDYEMNFVLKVDTEGVFGGLFDGRSFGGWKLPNTDSIFFEDMLGANAFINKYAADTIVHLAEYTAMCGVFAGYDICMKSYSPIPHVCVEMRAGGHSLGTLQLTIVHVAH